MIASIPPAEAIEYPQRELIEFIGKPAPAFGSTPAGRGLACFVSYLLRRSASCPNHSRGAFARQGLRKNDCSQKIDLEQLFGRSGRISRRSTSRSALAAANALRNSTSPAIASLRRAPSSRSSVRSTEFRLGITFWPGSARLGFQKDALRFVQTDRQVQLAFKSIGARISFSSGDGLGIHQPRSTTNGAILRRRQGRARDRVICPAVTRSFVASAA